MEQLFLQLAFEQYVPKPTGVIPLITSKMRKLSSGNDLGKALSGGGGGGHSFKMNFGGKSADDIFKAGPRTTSHFSSTQGGIFEVLNCHSFLGFRDRPVNTAVFLFQLTLYLWGIALRQIH